MAAAVDSDTRELSPMEELYSAIDADSVEAATGALTKLSREDLCAPRAAIELIPVLRAARFPGKDGRIIKLLIDHGVNPNESYQFDAPTERTGPLLEATRADNLDAVAMLLKCGAGINVEEPENSALAALHESASRGHVGILLLLLDKTKISADARDSNDATPLYHATVHSRRQVAECLLAHGANPDTRCHGQSPRELAESEHADMISILKKSPAQEQDQRYRGTSVRMAIQLDCFAGLSYLVESWTDDAIVDLLKQCFKSDISRNLFKSVNALAKRVTEAEGYARSLPESLVTKILSICFESPEHNSDTCNCDVQVLLRLAHLAIRTPERGLRAVLSAMHCQRVSTDSFEQLFELPRCSITRAITDSNSSQRVVTLVRRMVGEAARYGSAGKLEAVLHRGAPVGKTQLLHKAAGNRNQVIDFLLGKFDLDVNALNSKGVSPLMLACASRREENVAALLKHGASINEHDREGHSALHYAAYAVFPAGIKVLLMNGADIQATDKDGHAALYWLFGNLRSDELHARQIAAASREDAGQVEAPDEEQDVQEFSDIGDTQPPASMLAAIRMFKNHGCTIILPPGKYQVRRSICATIHDAINKVSIRLVEIMLELKSDPTIPDDSEQACTPLINAVRVKNRQIVNLLLAYGAPIDGRDKDGNTALHWAAMGKEAGLVQFLLERGANRNLRNASGVLPEVFARTDGNSAVLELLRTFTHPHEAIGTIRASSVTTMRVLSARPIVELNDDVGEAIPRDLITKCETLGKGANGLVSRGLLGGDQDVAIKELFYLQPSGSTPSETGGHGSSAMDIDAVAGARASGTSGGNFALTPEERGRVENIFRGECQMLASMDCEYLVTFRGYVEGDTTNPMLVIMELLQPISEDLRRERWPQIIRDVAAALSYLHGKGILHRDVKPGNVLYDATLDHFKLSDLGEAQVVEFARGRIYGTPFYMAPEVAACDKDHSIELTGAIDVFSLGVMILEFALESKGMPRPQSRDEILNPSGHPGVDDEVDAMACRCLNVNPALRPTAEDVSAFFARN